MGHLAERERERLLNSVIVASADQAHRDGASLALVRPTNSLFRYKKKSESDIAQESETYRRAAQQKSFFDKELAALKPTPYNFEFKFDDGNGSHVYRCGDWEVNAMFYNGLRRWGERQTLEWMEETFNVIYPKSGMVFALGNMASRPQTWQLLGVIRLDEPRQADLFG